MSLPFDTSGFEKTVLVASVSENGTIETISYQDCNGNNVGTYKFKVRKMRKTATEGVTENVGNR